MKKFLTIFLLIVVLGGAIFIYWHYFWVFGEGVKAGQLNNLMKKGYVFKTYEGKLIQVGLSAKGAAGSIQSNEFNFSVQNEKVAQLLMNNSGKQFELHYKEFMATVPWRGVSEYVVDSILSMKDAAGNTMPITP